MTKASFKEESAHLDCTNVHNWSCVLQRCFTIKVMRLLLVEDDVEIQNFLKRSLGEAGYQVDAAGDGKAAEGLATEHPYEVLIVDLGLPDQDGITLILKPVSYTHLTLPTILRV